MLSGHPTSIFDRILSASSSRKSLSIPHLPFSFFPFRLLSFFFFVFPHSHEEDASFQSRTMTTMKFLMADARKSAAFFLTVPGSPFEFRFFTSLVLSLAFHSCSMSCFFPHRGVLTVCYVFQNESEARYMISSIDLMCFQGLTAISTTVHFVCLRFPCASRITGSESYSVSRFERIVWLRTSRARVRITCDFLGFRHRVDEFLRWPKVLVSP